MIVYKRYKYFSVYKYGGYDIKKSFSSMNAYFYKFKNIIICILPYVTSYSSVYVHELE